MELYLQNTNIYKYVGITNLMVSIKKKKIKGRLYKYASKSVRLPNGKIVTVEKILSGRKVDSKEIMDFLSKRENDVLVGYALGTFKTDSVFTQHEIQKIEEMRIAYKKIIRKLTKRQLQDLFDRFTVNFTYESNSLEGNSLTLKDVAIIIESNIVPKGRDLREIYDTRNSRRVIDMVLKKRFKINVNDVAKMHSILVKDMGIPRGFKKMPNYILGRNIKTTPPERVERELNDLLEWIIKNPEKLHPLHIVATSHGKFERIHPFEDGNGRVGRFLINLILANNGYPPLIIRKTQRLSYLNALQDFDSSRPEALERFILERYKETFRKFFEIYARYTEKQQ